MRTIFTLLLSILVFGCNVLFAQIDSKNTQKTTVVVIDKSEEITDKVILEKCRQKLQTIIWNACQKNGDKIVISYIFENSGSMTNKTEFTLTLPSLDIAKLSPQKQKLMRRKFESIIKQKRISFVKEVTQKALSYNKERPRSHILDVLPLLSKFRQIYGVYDLYFISDLIEFSTYRNLHKTHFSSANSAQKIGQQDAKKIARKFNLQESFLQGISIYVYFPVNEMETRPIFEWLPYYWNSVFQTYGANPTNIKYQKL
ncbi:hypothetical protein ACQY1Q_10445 [Tenacibaculum sp. TC6]|uniref:hypothetical protein n=1 Tax=Tenacibaculum sp. TC6 TaxID=3423223 RepID=UPI003D3644A6